MESLLGTSKTTGVEDIASSTGIPMTNKKIQRYIKSKSRPALESEGEMSLYLPRVLLPVCFVPDLFPQLL